MSKHFFIFFALFFFASGNQLAPVVHDPTAYHQVLWGSYLHVSGRYQRARQLLASASRVLRSPAVYRWYASALHDAHEHAVLVCASKEFDRFCVDDEVVQCALAQAYEAVGNKEEALKRFAIALEKNGDDPDILYQACQAYLRAGKADQVLALVDNFLERSPRYRVRHVFHFLASQAWEQLKQPEKALERLAVVMREQPAFGHGWLLWGVLQEQQGRLRHALEGYEKFVDLVGSSHDAARKVAALSMHHRSALSLLDKAGAALEQKDARQALEYAQNYLLSHPHNFEALILSLCAWQELGDETSLFNCLRNELRHAVHDDLLAVVHQLFHQPSYQQKIAVLVHEAVQWWPDNERLLLYALDIDLRLHDLLAVDKHATHLVKIVSAPALIDKIAYECIALAYELKNYEMAMKWCDFAWLRATQDPSLCNTMAYMYAMQEPPLLERAHELIDRALRAQPDNPHYRDTLALIYDRQGKQQTACVILQDVVHSHPDIAEIQEHYHQVCQSL